MKAGPSFVLALGLALGATAHAETRLGIHAGGAWFNQSRETPTPGLSYGWRTGFQAGAILEWSMGGKGALRLEPAYVQKGADLVISPIAVGPPLATPVNGSLQFDYLDLPVLARREFGSGGVRPFILGGITASYLLEARALGGTDAITDLYRRWDLGLSAGGGIGLGRGRARGFLEARYTLGLLNVEHANSESRGALRNQGLQALAGVLLALGR